MQVNMMTGFTLTLDQARTVLLAAQGLLKRPSRPPRKRDVLKTIQAMGALQIDTIHVVNRSPYLVLWSRLGHYNPRWLDELLTERALFEYWAHAACFLSSEDYPLYRYFMLNQRKGGERSAEWVRTHPEAVERVLTHIRANGGARSFDFERTDGQKGGWWNWKDEKIALEYLFILGDLMIARRVNFHRIYDLRERVRPNWDDANVPTEDTVRRTLVCKSVRALGVAPARWLPDYLRMKKLLLRPLLDRLVAEGLLLRGEIEGWQDPVYAHPDTLPWIKNAAFGKLRTERTTLLSPFDPVVWDRARALELFGFDYKIECYTPAPRRRYGYFTLPILHRGRLVGRLDPKAHRKEGVFEIKILHLEPDVAITDVLASGIATTLHDIARWHQTPEVIVHATKPEAFREVLNQALAQSL
jgi:uncharacterized protein YcaQ